MNAFLCGERNWSDVEWIYVFFHRYWCFWVFLPYPHVQHFLTTLKSAMQRIVQRNGSGDRIFVTSFVLHGKFIPLFFIIRQKMFKILSALLHMTSFSKVVNVFCIFFQLSNFAFLKKFHNSAEKSATLENVRCA